MAKKIFKEKQHFFSLSFKWVLVGIALLVISVTIRPYFNPSLKLQFYDIVTGLIGIAVSLTLIWFLFHLSLKTAITKKGIEYKMAPFHNHKRIIYWDEIKFIRIVSIPRLNSWQKSYNNYLLQKKFTFSGRNGMSVETTWGERIFIGSGKVDELRKAINKATQRYKLIETDKD